MQMTASVRLSLCLVVLCFSTKTKFVHHGNGLMVLGSGGLRRKVFVSLATKSDTMNTSSH